MSITAPLYFYAFPKLASKSSSDTKEIQGPFNYENPLKRIRSNIKKSSNQKNTATMNFPYPSSYFPDIFFKNTVPHPYLIFYNLHLLDSITEKGKSQIGYTQSIIIQLNNYFGVTDILSFTSTKNDYYKISETWNNRFPDAKSSSFSILTDDSRIKDIQDIQSLHLLAFQLNATFYLIFKISDTDNGSKMTRYYNMKLGPDSSDFDIHFLVHENIDKGKITFIMRDGTKKESYKHDTWLSLELIEISKISGNDETKFYQSTSTFVSENGGIIFLELEKRDPIPFIQIPSRDTSSFQSVIYRHQKSTKKDFKCNISFDFSKDLRIDVIAKTKYNNRINKIKSIVTTIGKGAIKKDSDLDKTNKLQFENFFFAQTNRSAFLVNESETNNTETNSALEIFQTLDRVLSFPPIDDVNISNEINKNIISYRKRLKYPITYGQIASSKHPLIYILCNYNVISIMLTSADYINEALKKDSNEKEGSVLKVVPIENDDIFFTYEKYKDCEPTEKVDDVMAKWKKLTDTYPQIMPPGSLIYHSMNNAKYKDNIKNFAQEDSPLFSLFYTYLIKVHSGFYIDHSNDFQPISKQVIDHIKENKIGLNPIVTPVIYREFMQLSKTCCIYYFSNKKYNKPINDLLVRDIQTVKECTARTTVRLFEDEEVVEENAKIGAFPIKKQSFMKMLEMKGNKIIPDPSFDFKEHKDKRESLLNAIIGCDPMEFDSLEPNFLYKFYPIINDEIIYTSQFAITSHYKLKYAYVSRGNVFSVGVNKENNLLAFGKCKTLDTEIQFDKPIEGEFKDALYLEENACFIICYANNGKCYFIGYDEKGKINQSQINDFKDDVKSLTVVSRTFFASCNGSQDADKGISVFKYNSKERRIEFNKYAEKWRISDNGKIGLCKLYLQNESNRGSSEYKPCFIGTQFSYGFKTSTFCIYKYDSKEKTLLIDSQNENSIQPNIDFSSESDFTNSDDQSEENFLLEKRISNKGKQNVIPTMMNLLPTQEKNNYTPFDLRCSLCELFPIPISINKQIITYSNNLLSFYSCDHKIYRTLSHQIYGFYINTLARINLFSVESLLKLHEFERTQIVLIIDTCGIAAKFSNMFFGTRFEEKDVLTDEIWTSFSYSNKNAAIIFILRIDDVENLYNAVNKENISPVIFFCKKDGIKYSIKLGFPNSDDNKYKELIKVGYSNKAISRFIEITFVSNTEFQNNLVILKEKYDNSIKKESLYRSSDALNYSKDILVRYLAYGAFVNYPLETVEKYAKDTPPNCKTIEDYINSLLK